jgi:hypothetical protein
MDVKATDNCEIYENTCYRDPDFTGEGGSGSGGFPTLIVVHEGPDDVHSRNNIIRDNRFLGGDVAAIKTANVSNLKIYRNEFENSGLNGLRIQGDSEDIQFFNNLLVNSSIWQNNNYTGVMITNNTLYNSPILIDWCEGTGIHNNISYSEEPDW